MRERRWLTIPEKWPARGIVWRYAGTRRPAGCHDGGTGLRPYRTGPPPGPTSQAGIRLALWLKVTSFRQCNRVSICQCPGSSTKLCSAMPCSVVKMQGARLYSSTNSINTADSTLVVNQGDRAALTSHPVSTIVHYGRSSGNVRFLIHVARIATPCSWSTLRMVLNE